MLTITVAADLEKRFLPFLKKGSEIRVVIDPFSVPKTARVQLELKEGLSSDMTDAMGAVSFVLNFDSQIDAASNSDKFEDTDPTVRRPALPHVENEYDEIRGIVDSDLGSPVQTLSSGKKQSVVDNINKIQTKSQAHKKAFFVVPDPEPIPEKKVESGIDADNMQSMLKQMQLMMAQMQAMKNGTSVPSELVTQEEEDFPSIMTAQEFFEALNDAGSDLPDIDLSRKLSKDEAVELEKYKINKPAYVVSDKGLLFIDDVGISVKQSLACNLSSIPTFKLKRSSDLIRCLKNGMLKFVNYKTAKSLAEKAEITSATEGTDNKLKTFFGENGSGVDLAAAQPIDVTPGLSDESASDRILHRASSGRYTDGIIVDDIAESDGDEQTDLINLSGGDMNREDEVSEALMASERDRGRQVSRTWKPSTRLD